MNNVEIDAAINNLGVGSGFVTPDHARGVLFSITNVMPIEVQVELNSGSAISRQAFFCREWLSPKQ